MSDTDAIRAIKAAIKNHELIAKEHAVHAHRYRQALALLEGSPAPAKAASKASAKANGSAPTAGIGKSQAALILEWMNTKADSLTVTGSEIAEGIGRESSAVSRGMQWLIDRGYATHDGERARRMGRPTKVYTFTKGVRITRKPQGETITLGPITTT